MGRTVRVALVIGVLLFSTLIGMTVLRNRRAIAEVYEHAREREAQAQAVPQLTGSPEAVYHEGEVHSYSI